MKTCIEHLPIELWIEIFSYLEAHDLLKSFENLNHYFDQLLASDYLLFNVRLGKSNCNPLEYTIQPYWSDSILNRIISLQPSKEHKTSHIPEFLRWHCTKLKQLKSLTIKLRSREIPTICNVLQQLNSLYYLSIESIPNKILLDAILSAHTIRQCQLDFLQGTISGNFYSDKISNIEILNITFRNNLNDSIIYFLLSHMPKLKRFEMNSSEIYSHNIEWSFIKPLFILPELQTMKINCSLTRSDSKCFQNLHEIMPVLKHLHLNMNYNYCHEDLFKNLIYHWWPIFQKIKQCYITIKCDSYQTRYNDHMQIVLDKFQSILLAMNEQYNGSVNVKWIENPCTVFKTINISICKSC